MSRNQNQTFSERGQRFYRFIDSPITFLATLLGVAGIYLAVVEWRVRTIVSEPAFIQMIARQVRPSVVFDADGRVLADSGAMALLDEVPQVILPKQNDRSFIARILITPKRFIAEPVIESLDYSFIAVSAHRAKGLSWEIVLSDRAELISGEGPNPEKLPSPRYRLELVVQ